MNKVIIKMIESYQKNPNFHKTKKCRFIPTCSEYGKQCYKTFNFFYATYLTTKRILKCNPLHKMEYDPVPLKRNTFLTIDESMINYYYKKKMANNSSNKKSMTKN